MPWVLLSLVSATSIYFWLTTVSDMMLSAYSFFPILGVIAWEIMWVQTVVKTATILGWRQSKNRHFKTFGERSILLLIILHPAIFLVQRFIDSGQLPPQSYLSYVGPNYGWAVILGIAGLAVFLSYDLFRLFRKSLTRRRLYKYVSVLQAGAMAAIFIHGLAIGSLMYTGFIYVWIALGVVLVPCLVLYVINEFRPRNHQAKSH